MNEKKKQRSTLIFILGVTVALLYCGIFLYSRTVSRLLKDDIEQMLLESSSRGSSLIKEKINSDFMLLHTLADIISQSDELLSSQSMEFLAGQQKNEGIARFLLSDTSGQCKTTDNRNGSMADSDIFKESLERDEVLSCVPSVVTPGEQIVVLTVQILKDGQMAGTLSCVYEIENYEKTMENVIFDEANYPYVIQKDGTAVIWPSSGPNPIGLSEGSSLKDEAYLAEHPEFLQLKKAMEAGETGILKYKDKKYGEYYISYRPMELRDWYYIDVIPTDAVSHKSQIATSMIVAVSVLMALVILLMAAAILHTHKKHEQVLEKNAQCDRLTGLGNWQYFKELYSTLAAGKYAYVFFYLNDFRYINDVFGFSVGGGILKNIARELARFTQDGEYAARLSENYFALFLRHTDDLHFKNRLNNLFTLLDKIPVSDDTIVYDYPCSYTGGVCLIGAEELAGGFEQLNSKADIVVEGISSHATTWKYFDETVKSDLELRKSLAGDVYSALAEHQFIPYYQPIYDLTTNTICGAELLVRWNHPSRGILLPKSFLKLLEGSGCILEMDTIMLEAACIELQKWIRNGQPPVPLSLNISNLNLYRRDFIDSVCAIPKKYQIPTSLITLELHEEIALDTNGATHSTVRELKANGFRIATSSFKTSTTPLSLLTDLPLDIIEMRTGFLTSLSASGRNESIMRDIMKLSGNLGITAIATGVERPEDEAVLKRLGCLYAQGFLYARPMPIEEFETLVFEDRE